LIKSAESRGGGNPEESRGGGKKRDLPGKGGKGAFSSGGFVRATAATSSTKRVKLRQEVRAPKAINGREGGRKA